MMLVRNWIIYIMSCTRSVCLPTGFSTTLAVACAVELPCEMNAVGAILKMYFKDVSYEFDQFRVNTQRCKLRCW